MSTLDKVIQMQQQGISDEEIYTQLQNEGVAPVEIENSFNQAKIKNAVSPPENIPQEQMVSQGMRASITQSEPPMHTEPRTPNSQPPTISLADKPQTPDSQFPTSDYQPQDNYYQETPQAYSQQDYYAPQTGQIDTETISEIAEQVVTEKLNEYKNKIGDIASFRNTIQDKVDDIDDRLKRIENTIDKLQQAIVGKIGEFGETSAMIHKDLDNLHGTVAKLMNPLIDNYNELKKISK